MIQSNKNRKVNILMVGDKKKTNSPITKGLRKRGYHISFAHNYKEAMDKVGKKANFMVLTELQLYDRSGIALLQDIKKAKPEVQVIMLTEKGDVHSYMEAMTLGALEYFIKPVNNVILYKIIDKASVANNQFKGF